MYRGTLNIKKLCCCFSVADRICILLDLRTFFLSFQLVSNIVLLAGANMVGFYHKYMTDITHRHTFLEARKSIESVVKLEKEKKEQVTCSNNLI